MNYQLQTQKSSLGEAAKQRALSITDGGKANVAADDAIVPLGTGGHVKAQNAARLHRTDWIREQAARRGSFNPVTPEAWAEWREKWKAEREEVVAHYGDIARWSKVAAGLKRSLTVATISPEFSVANQRALDSNSVSVVPVPLNQLASDMTAVMSYVTGADTTQKELHRSPNSDFVDPAIVALFTLRRKKKTLAMYEPLVAIAQKTTMYCKTKGDGKNNFTKLAQTVPKKDAKSIPHNVSHKPLQPGLRGGSPSGPIDYGIDGFWESLVQWVADGVNCTPGEHRKSATALKRRFGMTRLA